MDRRLIGALIGIIAATFCWCGDMYFYKKHKGDLFELNKKKYLALFGGIIASVFGGILLGLYDFSKWDILKELIMMNSICFLGYLDHRERIVPNKYLLALLQVFFLIMIIQSILTAYRGGDIAGIWIVSLAGAAYCFACMFAGYFISKGGVGAGDIKLFTLCGFTLGFRRAFALMLLAFFLAAIYSIVQLLRKKVKVKDQFPMVPFIAVSSILIVYAGV